MSKMKDENNKRAQLETNMFTKVKTKVGKKTQR